jgi:hypothetical protein
LENWHNNRKEKDQGFIYKDFEEKSTFIKLIFKGKCYDNCSIYANNTYVKNEENNDNNIESNIEKIKTMVKQFREKKNDKVSIEEIEIDIKAIIEKLNLKLKN